MFDTLWEPFTYSYMFNAMWVSALVGGVCAFLSAYLMLKGWSLIGDALAHSVVPGVAGAYILGLAFAFGARFGFVRGFNLLGDRDPFACFDQPCQIAFGRMDRHTAHCDRLALVLSTRGQGDVEDLGGAFGILEEQLEKISHPIKQQRSGRLLFERKILLHHRGGF